MAAQSTYVSTSDAARALGIDESYVRRLLRAGTLPGERLGPRGRWLVRRSGLAKFQRDPSGRGRPVGGASGVTR